MPHFICTACGTQYADTARAPEQCPICEEERQYVPPRGQTWTTLEALKASHMNAFHAHEPGIIGIGATPNFAIGQRAILVQTPGGNVLWDCIAPLDDATVTLIKGLGGLKAVAISHPHFYTTMVEWSRAFGCPIHLHAADRDWVMRKDDAIRFWDGDTLQLWDGVTLVRCGGHFAGGAVLHWKGGADGKGIVCTGDTPEGRPSPYMIYRTLPQLGVWLARDAIKVDDTEVGIEEGINGGTWTVGVAVSGNAFGLTEDEVHALAPDEFARRRAAAVERLRAAGAHYVIDSVADLLPVVSEIETRLARGERP